MGILLLSGLLTISVLCLVSASLQAADAPKVVWASDPVLPNETVVLMGGDFGQNTMIEVGRLKDQTKGRKSDLDVEKWQTVKPLQISTQSAKFVIPREYKAGIWAFRVMTGGKKSEATLVNAPDPWWIQGDRGETASPGGWVRVFGKSLSFNKYGGIKDALAATAVMRVGNGKPITLIAKDPSCYSLKFELPADIAPGEYKIAVHNGYGGLNTWREAGTVTIAQPKSWPVEIFNVKELGLETALKNAEANGGGVIYFPRGRYEIKGQIKLPAHTVLKGESAELATIYWPDMTEPPASLITGNTFGIENLRINVQGYYLNVIEDTSGSDGTFLKGMRLRANAFFRLTEPGKEWRGRTAVDTLDKIGDAIVMRGKNFQITDCDILSSRRGLILENASNGYVARNIIRHGHNGFGAEGVNRIIIEDNEVVGGDMSASGNFVSSYGSTFSQNVYMGGNRLGHAYGYDQELMTFDAAGGTYIGKVTAKGTNMTLAKDPHEITYAHQEGRYPPDNAWVGAVACIMEGKGAGQYRRIVSHKGREWQIDKPWVIQPDQTSNVSIVPFRGQILFVGNKLFDGGVVSAYAMSISCVFAENEFSRASGITIIGRNPHWFGWQPSWFCQVLDNKVLEGNVWGQEETMMQTGTADTNEEYTGPLNRCVIFRRNDIHNSGRLRLEDLTVDALIEGCAVRNSEVGIRVGPDPRLIVLRNNTFENVDQTLNGEGIKNSVVVPAQ